MSTVSPSDEELSRATESIRAENPSLGILKVLALLKSQHPEWAVSEKRFRKINQHIFGGPTRTSGNGGDEIVAFTGIDDGLNVGSLAPKVAVKMLGGVKGKGLVGRHEMLQGEVLWQEEPWIATADSNLHQYLRSGEMCSQCFNLFSEPNSPMTTSCGDCGTARFCNRLCLARSKKSGAHSELLCPGRNPAARPLLNFVTSTAARHLDAVAKIVAIWRAAREAGDDQTAAEVDSRTWRTLARVNIEEKERARDDWTVIAASRKEHWRAGHALLVAALNPDESSKEFHSVSKALRRVARQHQALSEEEVERWFSYDSFLQLLGMVSINQEDSGGLYALHAHMNHSCQPNIQVRNLPKSFSGPTLLPSPLPGPNPRGVRGTNKLTMLARRTVPSGEELTVSYVNPELPKKERREKLRADYGFWCNCERCKAEQESAL